MKNLAGVLETLQVWVVPTIKVTHQVDDVIGADDTGSILFDDSHEDKLEITFALNTDAAVVNFELGAAFIEFCNIEPKFERMVSLILTCRLDDIDDIFEKYGKDLPNYFRTDSNDASDIDSILDEDNNAAVAELGPHAAASPGAPSPRSNTPRTPAIPLTASPSSFLRDRIPQLDGRISSIKAAASQASMRPTLVGNSSRGSIATALIPGAVHDSTQKSPSPAPRSGILTPVPDLANFSTTTESRNENRNYSNAFNFNDMSSALPDIFATPTRPSYNPSRTRHSSPRFSRNPFISRTEPDSSNTMEGIHRQYIGLQGEVFVSSMKVF